MRFGSHSHVTPDELDAKATTDRERLVRTLRNLADTIESAPAAPVKAGLAGMAAAADTLVRTVKLALAKQ
jgi:hypothetical protein